MNSMHHTSAWRRVACLAGGFALLLLAPIEARAAEPTGCAAFLWPIAKEQTAFARADLPAVASGAKQGAWSEQAFLLQLKPQSEVALPLQPSGEPARQADKPYAGTVAFEAPVEAGAYHVTLSGPAWIDVVQDGALLPPAAHTGAHDCPDVRKSVRFELTKAPVVLQISGSATPTVKIGIVPAVD